MQTMLKTTMYDDIYLRKNLYDNGSVPSGGDYYWSPDIITSGQFPINDIKKYAKDTWMQDVGVNSVARATNYVYVRGKNLKQERQHGKVSLYYSKASLIMYPSNWIKNPLKNSKGEDCVPVEGDPNEIVVTEDPFTWTPEMLSDNHYCFVAMVDTGDHKKPVPTSDNMRDLATFLYNNPNVAWRNVNVVDNGVDFSVPVDYSQGSEPGRMYIFVECSACPDGSEVSFTSGTPLPNGECIKHEWTNIAGCNPAIKKHIIVGATFDIPANFKTTIAYNYKSNGKSPLPGEDWSIGLKAAFYQDPSGLTRELDALADNSEHAKSQAKAVYNKLRCLEGSRNNETVTPGKFIGIGSHLTIGKK